MLVVFAGATYIISDVICVLTFVSYISLSERLPWRLATYMAKIQSKRNSTKKEVIIEKASKLFREKGFGAASHA